jgi:hypothetical protein
MLNWKRLFTNFGWAMSMTDPMCYSYYLASRLDSTDGKGTPDVAPSRMALRSLHARGRARPPVLQMTSQGTAGAKGLVVDPDAGAHDVALLVALLCSQKS